MEKRNALIALHSGIFLMGASGVFAKLISTSAYFLVFGRTGFAALALALVMHWKGRGFKPQSRKDAGFLIALGVLLAFHWFAFFHSIQVSSVALGFLTFSTFPVFTMVLEAIVFKEKLRRNDFSAAILCCAGVFLIAEKCGGLGGDIAVGMFWGVLAGLSYAVMLLVNKNYISRYSPTSLIFYQCLVACIVMTPVVLWRMEPVLPMDWVYLAVHGIILTALAFTLYVASTKVLSAKLVSVTAMLELVYGIILAWIVLGERMDAQIALGGALILLASYLVLARKTELASELAI